jgi:predicted nucleotidyltransferase
MAEARIAKALDTLKAALAADKQVASAVMYGSYVRGDYREDASDINLALVVRDDDLASLAVPLREAWRAARVDPWIARADELAGLADVFATRVRDIQRKHEVLVGDDPWPALHVPKPALRLRVEQELRNHQLRLRHAVVLSDDAGQSRQLHATAGALRLDLALVEELAGGTAVDQPDAIAAAVAKRIEVPASEITDVLGYHARRAPATPALIASALRVLGRAIAFVDSMEVA